MIYSHYLTYCVLSLCQVSCYLWFSTTYLLINQIQHSGWCWVHAAVARGWKAIDLIVVSGSVWAWDFQGPFAANPLGSLGKVKSQANKRDLLSKINHLNWHRARVLFHFSVPKHVDLLLPNMYTILEPQVTEESLKAAVK